MMSTNNGQLPSGWRWVKLGEVTRVVGGSTPDTNVPEYWGGDITWITPTDLGALKSMYILSSARCITQAGYANSGTELVPAGTIVLSSRAPIGHVGIAGAPLCTNQGCKSFVPSSEVDSGYLYWAIRRSVPDLQALGSGATFTEVSKSALENYSIPLPPLAEQQRIAARLNAQLAAVEQARAAAQAQVEAARALMSTHLREAFDSGKAEEWPRRRLDEIAKTTSGSTPPRGNGNYFGGKLPWVKTGELKDGEIWDTEERVTDAAVTECHLPVLPPGTLLIAMYGQGQTRGRTGLLRVPATTNQACFAVLPNPEMFDSEFLQLWFRRNYKALRDSSEGRGGNQPNLNGIVLNSLSIPVPPLDEQRSIVKMLSERSRVAEQVHAAAQSQLASIDAMPAALLRAAFSGKL